MLGVVDLPTYVIGVIAIILLPGPNSMFCLTVGAQYGVKKGYTAAAGVFIGDLVLMTLSALGAASLMIKYPAIFNIIKYVGGGYLAYLGMKMIIGAVKGWAKPVSDTVAEPSLQSPYVFGRALILSLLNPKAILFFISFFVQFVHPDTEHPMLAFFVLALILQFFSFLYLSMLIFSGDRLAATFRARPLWMVAGTGTVGMMFLGFGLRLATATME